jgi:hypothetical protein
MIGVFAAFLGGQAFGSEVDVSEFGARADDGQDDTLAVQKAMAACRERGASRIVFPKGAYDFFPDFAIDEYFFISNNDAGLKRVTFLLRDADGLVVDGQGSAFRFHGFVNPFILDRAKRVTLQDFSIDFSRPFHSEAVIVGQAPKGLDVEIKDGFPYEVQQGTLLFTGAARSDGPMTSVTTGDVYGSSHILEYDTAKRETAYMARDYYFGGITGYPAQQLEGRKVRVLVPGLQGAPGNTMVFGPNHRLCPGVVASDCRDITLRDVTIHHAGGMGFLAQRTHNVTIDRCRVTPSHGRMVSTTADATHFVNCTGKLVLSDNLFENQKDDATNIHGVYVQVAERTGEDGVIVRLRHRQQHGFDFLEPGKTVEFVRGKSMVTYATKEVSSVERINRELTRLTLKGGVPEALEIGDALAEVRDYPEVLIRNNTIRNNRARGMLLNCRGPVVVEGNYFHTPGAAILFEGDAFHWFEQGGVRDCVIRNNTFDNCLFGVWGKAVIDVKAGIREDRENSRYNKNIVVTENVFRLFGSYPLLNAYCVDGITWERNSVERTQAYPPRGKASSLFLVEYSDNVTIDGEPFPPRSKAP